MVTASPPLVHLGPRCTAWRERNTHNDHCHMLLTTSVKALFTSLKTMKPLYERQGIIGGIRVTLVPYGLTKRSCYVIAACSEKELPDSFTHSRKASPQPLTNLTAQHSVQRPNGRSPTAPNEPQRPANLRAIHSRSGHVDANASRA